MDARNIYTKINERNKDMTATKGKDTVTLGIRDLKISRITKDDENGVTYDTPVDVPGVKEITIDLISDEKELTGDGVILDTFTKKKGYEVSFKNAQLSQEIMDIINGTTTTETGETGSKVYTTEDDNTNQAGYFALEFTPEHTVGEKDYHRILYKVSGNYKEEYAEEDYMVCSFSGKGVARTYDKKFGARKLYEEITDITQIPAITKS